MYQGAKFLSNIALNTFFRDIQVIGNQNIPQSGPLIIYGNHNNQFADGLLMITKCKRYIKFLAAQKSINRPFIGHFCKAFGVIPVKRAIDLLKPCSGKLIKIDGKTLYGQNTRFKSQLQQGGLLRISSIQKQMTVSKIISDTQVQVKENLGLRQRKQQVIKSSPRLDFNQLYEHVWYSLSKNQCIGIFPQGGSHDRQQFLPFKAGIVIMALGAAQKYPGLNPVLLPCGFNYFNQDKFRSKVVIEFGQPFSLSQAFLQLYKKDRRTAITQSLALVQRRLKNVTLHAPSFHFLKTLFMMRSLYMPLQLELKTKTKLQIVRSFAQTYQNLKQDRQVQNIFNKANQYRQQLQNLNISDKSHLMPQKTILRIFSVLYSLIRLLLCLGLSLPGGIILGPVIFLIRRMSEKQRIKCLNQSRVKLLAKDVVASYKMILGAIFFPIYSVIISVLLYFYLLNKNIQGRGIATLACIIFWIIYVPIAIRSFDGVLSHFNILRSKIAALFNPDNYKILMRMRQQLREQVLEMVNDKMIPILKQQGDILKQVHGLGQINLQQMFIQLNDLQNI